MALRTVQTGYYRAASKLFHFGSNRIGGLPLVERRIAKRFKVDWGIKVSGTSADGARIVETGLLRDLSTRGAYAYLINRLEVGSSVEVMIRLPLNREGWISYPAKVLRVDPDTTELGVAFIFDTARPVFVPTTYIV